MGLEELRIWRAEESELPPQMYHNQLTRRRTWFSGCNQFVHKSNVVESENREIEMDMPLSPSGRKESAK